MTACIIGWAHTPFGRLDTETVESLIVSAARIVLASDSSTLQLPSLCLIRYSSRLPTPVSRASRAASRTLKRSSGWICSKEEVSPNSGAE